MHMSKKLSITVPKWMYPENVWVAELLCLLQAAVLKLYSYTFKEV